MSSNFEKDIRERVFKFHQSYLFSRTGCSRNHQAPALQARRHVDGIVRVLHRERLLCVQLCAEETDAFTPRTGSRYSASKQNHRAANRIENVIITRLRQRIIIALKRWKKAFFSVMVHACQNRQPRRWQSFVSLAGRRDSLYTLFL